MQFPNIHWGRALLAGIAITLFTTVVIFLLVGAYAMVLAVQAQGAPDEARIETFANQLGVWGTPVMAIVFTLATAAWVARRTEGGPGMNGAAVGLVAAITGLAAGVILGGALDWLALAAFVLTTAAGWLGGALGAQK